VAQNLIKNGKLPSETWRGFKLEDMEDRNERREKTLELWKDFQ
jgi:hypothetical protein